MWSVFTRTSLWLFLDYIVLKHTLWSQVIGEEYFVLIDYCLLYTIFFFIKCGFRSQNKPYTNLVLSYKQSSYSPHRWKTWNKPVYFVAWVQLLDTLQGNLLLLFIQLCPTLCNPMDWSTSVFNISQSLLKLYVHRVGDAIQPSHLSPSSPPA